MSKQLKPAKKDPDAPPALVMDFGKWGRVVAGAKIFSTGSCGYHASMKIQNPESGEVYQVSVSIILVGSKPKAAK